MEEKLNVKEFIDGYLKSKNKQVYIKKIKTVNYIRYERKTFLCQKIVETTSYDENKNVRIDSTSRYVVYIYTLLSTYTNLDVKAENMLDDFNALNEHRLIDEIIGLIDEAEINEFNKVLSMTLEDFMTNHYGVQGFIRDLMSNIGNVIQDISPELTQFVKDYIPELE